MKPIKELKKRLNQIQDLEQRNSEVKILEKAQYIKALNQDVSMYLDVSTPQIAPVIQTDDQDTWQTVTRGKKAQISKPVDPVFLDKRLTQTVQTRPDGSCLFQALGHWLDLSATDVRRRIVSWLSENSTATVGDLEISVWIEAEQGMRFSDYLAKLKWPETWGGQAELFAASQMFKMRVCVWGQDECSDRWALQHEFLPGCKGKPTRHAHVLYLGGRHYDVLTLKDEVAKKL